MKKAPFHPSLNPLMKKSDKLTTKQMNPSPRYTFTLPYWNTQNTASTMDKFVFLSFFVPFILLRICRQIRNATAVKLTERQWGEGSMFYKPGGSLPFIEGIFCGRIKFSTGAGSSYFHHHLRLIQKTWHVTKEIGLWNCGKFNTCIVRDEGDEDLGVRCALLPGKWGFTSRGHQAS